MEDVRSLPQTMLTSRGARTWPNASLLFVTCVLSSKPWRGFTSLAGGPQVSNLVLLVTKLWTWQVAPDFLTWFLLVTE